MDAKAIQRHAKDLNKASENPNDPSTAPSILTILSDLKSGVKASEDILRSTRVGIAVNNVKRHRDPAVQRMANELVGKWKRDVGKGGSGSPRRGGTPTGAGPNANGVKGKESGAGVKVAKEKRSAAADGVVFDKTGDQTRDACARLIYDGLAFMSEEGTCIRPRRPAQRMRRPLTRSRPQHRPRSSPSPNPSSPPP